jgi:eukaryotic-like serine/threonine-protein kinase
MAALTRTVLNARLDCHGIERNDTIEDQNRVIGPYIVADGQEEPNCDGQRSPFGNRGCVVGNSMTDQQRRPAFFWLVLLICVVYAGFFAFTIYAVVRYYGVEKAPGWSATRNDGTAWFVTEVDAEGPAAGRIQLGDQLLAIDGDQRRAVIGLFQWVFVDGGKTYRVDLDRRGERVSVELPMPLVPGQRLTPIFALVGLAFFICGATVALLRPQDPQVRLAGAFLMSVGFVTLLMTLQSTFTFLVGWERKVHYLVVPLSMWTWPLAYHFFSRFPVWRSPGPAWRIMRWLLYAVFVVVIWPAWVIIYLGLGVSDAATRFMVDHPSLYLTAFRLSSRPVAVYIVVCFVLSLVVIARNYRRLPDPDSRRRIKWIIAGAMVAVIPFVAIHFVFSIAEWGNAQTYYLYASLSFLGMLCIPLSIGAAVWKEQLFDIRVLVRRGLQYLFARTALRALLALPIAMLVFSIFSNPNRTVAQILTQGSGWLNVVWIGAIAATLYWRRRVQTWLDRRFFREDYQQEQVLVHLIDEVRRQDSLAEIAQLVSARISSVLHPTSLHVFYRERGESEFVSGRSASQPSSQRGLTEQQSPAGLMDDAATQRHLSQQEALLRMLDHSRLIRDFPSDFTDGGDLPEDERSWLENLRVRLVVPITGTGDRLVGVLLLGARMSDEPYSATDRRLLEGVAAQIGLVYENQHLRERVRLETDVRRDVLGRLEERGVSLLKECPKCGACNDSTADRCEQDGAELILTLPVERTLDGKYRLERALGRGGFGVVYEATDLRLKRRVAAKVMMGSSFGNVAALRRFEREARAAARLDHRNITRVYDYGAVGSGGAYLVMELVAGRTWRAELQRSAVIDPARSAEWFRQLLEGLQFAHNIGVVHRDLKPENVMIVEAPGGGDELNDELKIMDFGLAKVLRGGTGVTESLTEAGAVMGTFGYIAPEVFTGGAVDERADIFAIGVMVVETFVGERPFGGQTPQEILTTLLQSEYHLPGESTEIRALDAVVQRCLAKDPRDRYGSATEVARELVPTLACCAGFEARALIAARQQKNRIAAGGGLVDSIAETELDP